MEKSGHPDKSNASSRYGFEIFFKEDEKYYFRFNDADGEPLLFGKGYTSEKSCTNGIQAIIRAAGDEERYELQETKKGKYFFILKSGNHKEIGRSRIFDTLEEMDGQMELLKGIDKNVPQYNLADTPPETVEEAPEEKEKVAESPVETTKMPKAKHTPQPESLEKMPRYKFSVIYYPDSRIWKVKNDLSGGSLKLKTCDGQKIEAFLIAQLPPKERETLQIAAQPEELVKKEAPAQPKPSVEQAPAAQPRAVQPEQPVKKEAPAPPKEPILGEVELKIKTYQGELTQKFAKKGSIDKAVLTPKNNKDILPLPFDAQVIAKSMESRQATVIGLAQKQDPREGRFEIAIDGANDLKAGLYMLSVNIEQSEEGEQRSRYYGSQMVMLN